LKSVSGKEFIKVLEHKGWRFLRSRTYESPSGEHRVVVPVHGSATLKVGMQRGLMKQTGITETDL
jgi:predicted RNA binding protein YcfA (HicA-like mRNA interferase family)